MRHIRGLPPTCHPDKVHYGKGLCRSCYMRDYNSKGYRKEWYRKNKTAQCAKGRARYAANKQPKLDYCKQYRTNNPDKEKNRTLLYRYGITLDTYNELLNKQNNVCKLCQLPMTDRKVVEHNHVTGLVRGIVHQKCNMLIAGYEYSLPWQERIKHYLAGEVDASKET